MEQGTPESLEGAVYCEGCEMWLSGATQWEDHKIGKKHKKNDPTKTRTPKADKKQWEDHKIGNKATKFRLAEALAVFGLPEKSEALAEALAVSVF